MHRPKPSQEDGLPLLPVVRGTPLLLPSMMMAASTCLSCSSMLQPTGKSHFSMVTILPLGSMMKRALKQMFSSILYTPYFLATSPTGSEANLPSLRHGSSLVLDLAGDVLRGDGQQGAVEGGELLQERLQGVELGWGHIAKVHGVEHQDYVLVLHGREADGLHLPVQHRVQGEVRGDVTRYQGHRDAVIYGFECWM